VATLLLGALLGTLASAVAASPASAGPDEFVCGAWKTIRVSIHYQACNEVWPSLVRGRIVFQNNHGSPVRVTAHLGKSVNGGPVQYLFTRTYTLPYIGSRHSYDLYPIHCLIGDSIRAVVRVGIDGAFGSASFSTAVICGSD
jgi:hypothetical protein